MTTDLTDGSELSEEEFAWDVFAPDPDESEIAAEAAALEDEDELDLDDSHLDWEAAMREPETMGGPEGEARAGAAYDRIVDTVRRSVEDPENAGDVVDEDHVDEVPDVVAALEPEATGAPGLAWLDLDDGIDGGGAPAPATWQDGPTETERGPWVPTAAAASFEPVADSDGEGAGALRGTPSWEEPDLGWEPAWEPAPEPDAHEVPTFEPDAATALALAPPTWAPELESEPEEASVVTPALHGGADADAAVDAEVDVAAIADGRGRPVLCPQEDPGTEEGPRTTAAQPGLHGHRGLGLSGPGARRSRCGRSCSPSPGEYRPDCEDRPAGGARLALPRRRPDAIGNRCGRLRDHGGSSRHDVPFGPPHHEQRGKGDLPVHLVAAALRECPG